MAATSAGRARRSTTGAGSDASTASGSIGALLPVAERPRGGQEGVIGLSVPDGDADAVRRVRADADARLIARGGEVFRLIAERQPDEVCLRWRHGPALPEQLVPHPVALFHDRLDPLHELGLSGQRG